MGHLLIAGHRPSDHVAAVALRVANAQAGFCGTCPVLLGSRLTASSWRHYGFGVGLAQDLIEGAPLGVSCFGLMVATLVLLFSYQRIRQFDGLQQSLVILALMALSLGIEGWLRAGIDLPTLPLTGLLGLAISMLCWIPTRHVCRQLRRHYGVV